MTLDTEDLSRDFQIQRRRRIVEIPAARDKEIEIGTFRDSKMEASIVNSMRRYFQSDSGKPRQDLESAILDSMTRYFEGPRH
jgi:hypothetical protein